MNTIDQNYRKKVSSAVIAATIFILTASLACGGVTQSADVEATIAAGVEATRQAEVNMQATIDAAVAATQDALRSAAEQPTAAPSVSEPPASPTPTPIPDPQQVRDVILNEVNGAIAQDLALLQSLYAPDAVVIDHNGTPDDPSDDTTWRGWANIERRYLAFFSAGYSSLTLVELSVQMNGERATGTHRGVVLDGTLYPDRGIYTVEKLNGRWLITQLEFGNEEGYDGRSGDLGDQAPRDDGLYILEVGNQHRYEEPLQGLGNR